MATITICSDFGAPQNDDKCTYSQSYVFSSSHAWMWELDHKQAECQRTDAFTLWCWSKFLRVPLAARRSNLSILKEISPEYSLERLMAKLKLQYFGHLMQRTNSLEKSLMLGKIESRRRRWRQRMRWLNGNTDSMDMNLGKLGDSEEQGSLACCSPWRHKSQTWLSSWTARLQEAWGYVLMVIK